MFSQRGSAAAVFNPLTLSPAAWYDPSDITTLFQDSAGTTPVTASGQPVGKMLDKSGNGYHLLQATAGSRPLYIDSGGIKLLRFDGTASSLAVAATLTQPWDRVSGFMKNTLVSATFIYSGGGGDTGSLYEDSATTLSLYDGSLVTCQRTVAASTLYVATERHNGASSQLALDNGGYATGNPGTTAGNQIIVGTGVGNGWSNMDWHGFCLVLRAYTAGEIANLRTYYGAKQGRVL